MKKTPTQLLGQKGEAIAKSFLIVKGFEILSPNFRKSCGEIDLICLDDDEIVFVEVKARTSLQYGAPELAVDKKKVMKIIETGFHYLKENDLEERAWRVDVVAILMQNGNEPEITHYKGIRIDG